MSQQSESSWLRYRGVLAALVLAALPAAAGGAVSLDAKDQPQPPVATEPAIHTASDRTPEGEPATPAATGKPLDLAAAVRIALAENPLLRAAAEGVAAAGETVGIARAAYYPEVGLDSRYRRFDTHVFLPAGVPATETTLGATDDWSAGFKVGYSLYDSGVRRAETATAKAGLAASREDAQRVRQDVVFGVHEAFYRVVSAEAARSAVAARVDRARDHLRLAETLKDAGAVPQADVLRARVELADSELAMVRAEGEVKTAYGDFNTAMGLPAALPVVVEPPTMSIPDPGAHDPEESLSRALQQRPELAAARERIAAAKHQKEAIAGSYGPRIRAEASLGVRDEVALPEDEDWSIGVALQLPIFSGFAKTHRVERASLEAKILEAEAEALANRVGQEVWAAASELASAAEAVRRSAELKAEAEQSVAFTRARYEAGAGTINDLLDAESTLTQADSTEVASVLGYRLATALVLRVQGDL